MPGLGSSVSYTGSFVHDNDVQFFNFTLTGDGSITLRTLGYGGGLNANNVTIAPGGFEPILQIYTAAGLSAGGEIDPGPNGGPCGVRKPDPARNNQCQDAYASGIVLPAGDYIVALTQNANVPLGNLADGFLYDGVGNEDFNSGFGNGRLPPFFYQGTANWALDITTPDSTGSVPEPNSALLAAGAIALACFGRRSMRCRKLW